MKTKFEIKTEKGLLKKELIEVNASINLLLKERNDLKAELKTIYEQDFALLNLPPLNSSFDKNEVIDSLA